MGDRVKPKRPKQKPHKAKIAVKGRGAKVVGNRLTDNSPERPLVPGREFNDERPWFRNL
jgi:hypothetical protein